MEAKSKPFKVDYGRAHVVCPICNEMNHVNLNFWAWLSGIPSVTCDHYVGKVNDPLHGWIFRWRTAKDSK